MQNWQSSRNSKVRKKSWSNKVSKISSAFVLVLLLVFGAPLLSARGDLTTAVSTLIGKCRIKGNISAHDGKKIFHVPGQKFYMDTRINVIRGERWFCSEAQARAAGWRQSRI